MVLHSETYDNERPNHMATLPLRTAAKPNAGRFGVALWPDVQNFSLGNRLFNAQGQESLCLLAVNF
jgi:hypothetical protein